MMRKIQVISLAGILLVAGCQSGSPASSTKLPIQAAEETDSVSPVAAIEPAAGTERVNHLSVWDELAAKHPDNGTFILDSASEPDMFRFYLEGLRHSNPYVQWYACNRMIWFDYREDKQEALDALKLLTKSKKDGVKQAAQFALHVFERDFDDEAFSRSPDGKRTAFHLYNEARYNDGIVWIYDSETRAVNPLPGEWPSIERLVWSPDSRALAVEFGGRIWGNVDLIDPATGDSLLQPGVFDLLRSKKLYTADKQGRPDPYNRLVEWDPKGRKAMLSYAFTDDDYNVQQGVLVYDIAKSAYTDVKRYPSGTDSYPRLNKPEGFKW
ncbi:hypothetical protein [Cohnella terricola]|uniref:Uncharacterized protein n=1 Tax=Cohnella terricola TaxID=1289167 RepID=A0A559JXA8_9BACL|nr:hypothetical protein [Cohnella terricola]TVY04519.1 hypothetical protein FPZ45_02780 [Cohnella terricola]